MSPRRTHLSSEVSITSRKNPLLKEIRKATERGSLTDDGLCVAEGFHLLEEARRGPCTIESILASQSAAPRIEEEVIVVADSVFSEIASTETSQGVVTLVRPASFTLEDLCRGVPLIVVLDGIQDPGNAGTLVR